MVITHQYGSRSHSKVWQLVVLGAESLAEVVIEIHLLLSSLHHRLGMPALSVIDGRIPPLRTVTLHVSGSASRSLHLPTCNMEGTVADTTPPTLRGGLLFCGQPTLDFYPLLELALPPSSRLATSRISLFHSVIISFPFEIVEMSPKVRTFFTHGSWCAYLWTSVSRCCRVFMSFYLGKERLISSLHQFWLLLPDVQLHCVEPKEQTSNMSQTWPEKTTPTHALWQLASCLWGLDGSVVDLAKYPWSHLSI
jgi:hypothetical protein